MTSDALSLNATWTVKERALMRHKEFLSCNRDDISHQLNIDIERQGTNTLAGRCKHRIRIVISRKVSSVPLFCTY
jgi:hypothetical protein